jgi:dihydrodipicolinate reductase
MALKIAIAGAGGRMGRMLLEATLKDSQATLVQQSTSPGAAARQGRGRNGRLTLRRDDQQRQ